MSQIRRTTLVPGPPGPPGVVETSAAWTPGIIASGAFASTVVALTGALVGFPVLAAFSLSLPDGMHIWAQVKTVGNVTVYLFNASGSSQTIAAGSVLVEALTQ